MPPFSAQEKNRTLSVNANLQFNEKDIRLVHHSGPCRANHSNESYQEPDAFEQVYFLFVLK
jgi:hypothetical protein